ncbi:LDH2 family malate/lactate/ureidoglycolate dehydrogenase [Ancylobacter aquaticus]|uniref:LDH2 family malate/lactate/ureidoglycolate dehydrogenase n=1 Tax=Ancylobacter aquaticus TaxID=100 RepID=A0A4R1I6P6_ANCAQ|nr:Ldh family oxidoreductase [Ancylobacter aquaticus]TCK30648.1 LDH2 family malate/lactate/ureidoglycolate dehydrogenase [Ancylobacter aquaticus]
MNAALSEPATVRLSLDEVYALTRDTLLAAGLGEPHAAAIARSITRAQADECHSHGLYRLLGYVASVRSGKAEREALPVLTRTTPVILNVDARHAFAPLAIETGVPALIEAAKTYGIAALAIHDCYHFSALWADIEPAVEAGLAAWCFTVGQCCVAPAGGTTPLMGTNPIAFGWPGPEGRPFIFDFATSAAARGEVELKRRAGEALPAGWAVGPDGTPTTDPAAALAGALLPFGGHKGSALALMVELIAGPLIGDLNSRQAKAVENGDSGPPLGGELFIAIDPAAFGRETLGQRMSDAEETFALAKAQPGVRLPSERRYAARARSAGGVLIPARLLQEIRALTTTGAEPGRNGGG